MADRNIGLGNTLNEFRTELNGTAADVGDIADVVSASSFIASSTDLVEAIVAINTELPEIKTDAFIFPGRVMAFEGATDDSYETTLTVTDPTADRTLTLPNASGEITLITASQTMTNKTLTSPTMNGGTFSGTFTGTMDITGIVLSGASPLVFEGATDDAYETNLTTVDPTADRTISLPNATGTIVLKDSTDTFTNKSIDSDNNTITNLVNADIKAAAAIAFSKMANLTNSRLLVSDGSGDVSVSAVTSTEAGYLDGVTSAIQTQLTAKATKAFAIAQAVALG